MRKWLIRQTTARFTFNQPPQTHTSSNTIDIAWIDEKVEGYLSLRRHSQIGSLVHARTSVDDFLFFSEHQ